MISQEDINKLISIPGYEVKDLHFEQQGSEFILHIEIKNSQDLFYCHCGYSTDTYYDCHYFKVRDLPFGKWKIVYLWFKKHRIECPQP